MRVSEPAAALIRLEAVSKIYGAGDAQIRALDRVDLSIADKEFVAIMGPSGSGKSTAMNIIGCLDRPTEGRFTFAGTDAGALDSRNRALLRRHFLGFVFQGYNLLARVSALENVELPLVYRGVRSGERRKLALQALTRVGLSDRAHHDPSELSGGQQQRVAIARAIVGTPSVLVADEPTGNLDSATSVEVMDLLTALNRDDGITIIMVTHEPDMAEFAHRVVRFRDGHIETESANQGAFDHGH